LTVRPKVVLVIVGGCTVIVGAFGATVSIVTAPVAPLLRVVLFPALSVTVTL